MGWDGMGCGPYGHAGFNQRELIAEDMSAVEIRLELSHV